MNKEEKYSFIIEFDEMTDKQINNLTDYFNNNEIKFHVLKSNYELKKKKEINQKAIEYINQHWVIDDPVLFKNDLLQILEDKEVSE